MNEQTSLAAPAAEAPAGLPADHIVDFDFHNPQLDDKTVYERLKELHAGPDILWTAHNGGHWIVTRSDDIEWVESTHEIFSHEQFFLPRGTVPMPMPPITVDPPRHARFRAVLNPFFTPRKVRELEEKARVVAIETIEKLAPRGRCEFVGDFAHILPLIMFLGIVDLPLDRREEFLRWGEDFGRAPSQQAREAAMGRIIAYLQEILAERYEHPGDDAMSAIAAFRDNPRCEDPVEVLGMALQVFSGGLDTVANMLSFTAWYLAQHPELRRRLVEEPDIIPQAAEEFLRRFGLTNTAREVRQDVTRKGVQMKAGDMVLVPTALSSLDERKFTDPFTVDFDRKELFERGQPNHNTFGNGPHRCVGAPLARAEIRIFLEEWLKRIPDFALDPKREPKMHMGFVMGMDELHLVWDS